MNQGKPLLLLVGALLITSLLKAQTSRITGKIWNAEANTPLAGASVLLMETPGSAGQPAGQLRADERSGDRPDQQRPGRRHDLRSDFAVAAVDAEHPPYVVVQPSSEPVEAHHRVPPHLPHLTIPSVVRLRMSAVALRKLAILAVWFDHRKVRWPPRPWTPPAEHNANLMARIDAESVSLVRERLSRADRFEP